MEQNRETKNNKNCDDLTSSSFDEETRNGKIVTSYSYDKIFKDLMDVDNIAYIEFNGAGDAGDVGSVPVLERSPGGGHGNPL